MFEKHLKSVLLMDAFVNVLCFAYSYFYPNALSVFKVIRHLMYRYEKIIIIYGKVDFSLFFRYIPFFFILCILCDIRISTHLYS